jgi:hypothetical protein
MKGKHLNSSLLRSQLAICGMSDEAFANAERWTLSTAQKKISGLIPFSFSEIMACVSILALDFHMSNQIFFAESC